MLHNDSHDINSEENKKKRREHVAAKERDIIKLKHELISEHEHPYWGEKK
jgi:hypothetical protein